MINCPWLAEESAWDLQPLAMGLKLVQLITQRSFQTMRALGSLGGGLAVLGGTWYSWFRVVLAVGVSLRERGRALNK